MLGLFDPSRDGLEETAASLPSGKTDTPAPLHRDVRDEGELHRGAQAAAARKRFGSYCELNPARDVC